MLKMVNALSKLQNNILSELFDAIFYCFSIFLLFFIIKRFPSPHSFNYAMISIWFFALFLGTKVRITKNTIGFIFIMIFSIIFIFDKYIFSNVMNIIFDDITVCIRRSFILGVIFIIPIFFSRIISHTFDGIKKFIFT